MSMLSRVSSLFSRRANTSRANTSRVNRSPQSVLNRTRRSLGFRLIYSTNQVKNMTIEQLLQIPPSEFKFTKIHINELDIQKKTLLTIMKSLKHKGIHLSSSEIKAKYDKLLDRVYKKIKVTEDGNQMNPLAQELSKSKSNSRKSLANLKRIENAISRSSKSLKNAQNIGNNNLKKIEELKKKQRLARASRSSARYVNP